MPARPKPKTAILLKNAILLDTTWMMKFLHEPAIEDDNFGGGQ